MDNLDINKAKAHLILSAVGKKVLRPGGKELTQKLIQELQINSDDEVVEFAPGLGYTAQLILNNHPKNYVGIDIDELTIKDLEKKFDHHNTHFILANAAQTGLENNSKDKVIGEAMLTMQADHIKLEIIQESNRILKKGGLFAIHELGLNEMDNNFKNTLQKELSQVSHVNTRPLTVQEWSDLLLQEGFAVKVIYTSKMHLLEPKRMIDDEGFFGVLKIAFNILKNSTIRKRIIQIRKAFNKYQKNMKAVAIIAEKV